VHADVLVVPHVVTPFTDSLDPIKLYEYQAAGRPVVSTPVAGFRDVADDLVTVAASSAFVAAVVDAVAHAGRAGRVADETTRAQRSSAADWSRRVDQMVEILARLQARGAGS
jgi:glycosyltransferase involved in cell wall biosynthesis